MEDLGRNVVPGELESYTGTVHVVLLQFSSLQLTQLMGQLAQRVVLTLDKGRGRMPGMMMVNLNSQRRVATSRLHGASTEGWLARPPGVGSSCKW